VNRVTFTAWVAGPGAMVYHTDPACPGLHGGGQRVKIQRTRNPNLNKQRRTRRPCFMCAKEV